MKSSFEMADMSGTREADGDGATDEEVAVLRVSLPVLHGSREMPRRFPRRREDTWRVEIDPHTGEILDWPGWGVTEISLTVFDEGIYTLLDAEGGVIALRECIPVPHGLVPGRRGETVELVLAEEVIVNWPEKADFSDFKDENGRWVVEES